MGSEGGYTMPMCKFHLAWLMPWVVLLASCSTSVKMAARSPATRQRCDYTVTRDVVYTPPRWPEPVRGDVFRPRTPHPAPAVLLIHGGGWTGKDGRWEVEPIAKKLARRGYVVLNITYRLAPRWQFPAPLEDMQQAVKWLRDHAVEYGIDPVRIATFGYSAGGYLAAFGGLIEGPESFKIRAIVAGGAPSDLTFYPGGYLVPQFLGGTQREIPHRFREASPVNYVTSRSPPMFLYHATADKLVKPEHPLAMIRALSKNRVRHQTYWIKGRGHVSAFLLPAQAVDEAVDFLDREMR
jgi:acetyl esterase/lipase